MRWLVGALAGLGLERARLGAVEGQLLASLSNLQVAREQLAAAESHLRDAAAAQANLQATTVLRLLR